MQPIVRGRNLRVGSCAGYGECMVPHGPLSMNLSYPCPRNSLTIICEEFALCWILVANSEFAHSPSVDAVACLGGT